MNKISEQSIIPYFGNTFHFSTSQLSEVQKLMEFEMSHSDFKSNLVENKSHISSKGAKSMVHCSPELELIVPICYHIFHISRSISSNTPVKAVLESKGFQGSRWVTLLLRKFKLDFGKLFHLKNKSLLSKLYYKTSINLSNYW